MSKIIRESLELVSRKESLKIIQIDSSALTTNTKKFVAANEVSYYLACNTWLMLVKRWSPYGWIYLKERLLKAGLAATIAAGKRSSAEIIAQVPITDTIFRSVYRDVQSAKSSVDWADGGSMIGQNSEATMLFLCRYLKKFSPRNADLLDKKSLAAFDATQNRIKMKQRKGYNDFIVSKVRGVISRLNWEQLRLDLPQVCDVDLKFTSGSTTQTNRQFGNKLRALHQDFPEYYYRPFGCAMVAHGPSVPNQEYWGAMRYDDAFPPYIKGEVKLIVVPKTSETGRVIAPEDLWRQGVARRLLDILDRYLPSGIRIHDQTQNQRLAKEGACVASPFATLDLSSASDSLSRTLISDLFPKWFVSDYLEHLCPTHYNNNGKSRLLFAIATMGNALTFWLECVVFWAIATAAWEYTVLMGDVATPPSDGLPIVSVYGDDIILPSSAAELCVEWLMALGFVINEDKSYIHSTYKESCGVEYLDGINVSSCYYPRNPVAGVFGKDGLVELSSYLWKDWGTGESYDSLSSLVMLQHRLFLKDMTASTFLAAVIRETYARMTSSVPSAHDSGLLGLDMTDREFLDIWSYDDTLIMQGLPTGTFINGKLKRSRSETYKAVCHTTMIVKFRLPQERVSDTDRLLYSLYKYNKFLRYGPTYENKLDARDSISTPPLTLEEVFGSAESLWKTRRD